MKTKILSLFFVVAAGLALSACGGSDDKQPDPKKAVAAGQNLIDAGDYEIHINALSTDQVPPETARSYGIVRSQKRALLNVAIRHKESNATVESDISVEAVNLTGQLKNIAMRKIEETTDGSVAVYYIGEVPVANRETLIFDVAVLLPDTTEPFNTKFKRQFFSD